VVDDRYLSPKDKLVNYFIDQANWRDGKAEEYPEDARNAVAAGGLRELAAYVAALPDDDQRLVMLAALDPLDADTPFNDVFLAGEEAGRLASRFRFGHDPRVANEDPATFFTRWIEVYSRERTSELGIDGDQ